MESRPAFQTEVPFTLPRGYLDPTGVLHRRGVMRLATAADEILPQRDPRVQSNEAYLGVIILARVITRLGDLSDVDTKVVENLYAADFNFLQRLYERINDADDPDAALPDAGAEPASPPPVQAGPAALRGFRTVGEA